MVELAARIEETDARVIRRSMRTPAAFFELFERHHDSVYRFLVARCGSGGADLAVETFVVAFNGRDRYDLSRASAQPWLYGIALNLARNHRRGERRHLAALARLWERPSEPYAEALERLEAAGLRPVLRRALAQLREEERDLLLLHACVGLSYEELADVLALPPGTVRSRLHRAREKARRFLEGDTGES